MRIHKIGPNLWQVFNGGRYVGQIWQDSHPLGGPDPNHWYAQRGAIVAYGQGAFTNTKAHEDHWCGHGSKHDAAADLCRSPQWSPAA